MAVKPERILPFRAKPEPREHLQGCLNLGPKSVRWLVDAGFDSVEEIRRLGPIEVCRRLRSGGCPVSVAMAYALEGALAGCHWQAIPAESREALRVGFYAMKRDTGLPRNKGKDDCRRTDGRPSPG